MMQSNSFSMITPLIINKYLSLHAFYPSSFGWSSKTSCSSWHTSRVPKFTSTSFSTIGSPLHTKSSHVSSLPLKEIASLFFIDRAAWDGMLWGVPGTILNRPDWDNDQHWSDCPRARFQFPRDCVSNGSYQGSGLFAFGMKGWEGGEKGGGGGAGGGWVWKGADQDAEVHGIGGCRCR